MVLMDPVPVLNHKHQPSVESVLCWPGSSWEGSLARTNSPPVTTLGSTTAPPTQTRRGIQTAPELMVSDIITIFYHFVPHIIAREAWLEVHMVLSSPKGSC